MKNIIFVGLRACLVALAIGVAGCETYPCGSDDCEYLEYREKVDAKCGHIQKFQPGSIMTTYEYANCENNMTAEDLKKDADQLRIERNKKLTTECGHLPRDSFLFRECENQLTAVDLNRPGSRIP